MSEVSTSKALYASLSIVCAGVAEKIGCTGGPKISAPRAAGGEPYELRVRFEGIKHRLALQGWDLIVVDFFVRTSCSLPTVFDPFKAPWV